MTDHLHESDLHAYLDGELGGAELVSFETHLVECLTCAQRLESLSALFARIESVPDEPLTVDLAPEIVGRLRTQAQVGRRLRWLGWAELLAGGLTLAAVAAAGLPLPLPSTEALTGNLQAGWGEFVLSVQAEAVAVVAELQAGIGLVEQALRPWSRPSLPGLPLWWLWLVLAVLLWGAANRILLGFSPKLNRAGKPKGADHG